MKNESAGVGVRIVHAEVWRDRDRLRADGFEKKEEGFGDLLKLQGLSSILITSGDSMMFLRR